MLCSRLDPSLITTPQVTLTEQYDTTDHMHKDVIMVSVEHPPRVN